MIASGGLSTAAASVQLSVLEHAQHEWSPRSTSARGADARGLRMDGNRFDSDVTLTQMRMQ